MNDSKGLPKEFFENLSEYQLVLLQVLLDANGEYIRGVEIRKRMNEDHGLRAEGHPWALNSPLGGFTQRYSREFREHLIPGRWENDDREHAEFKIGSKYEREIGDRLR